MKNTPPPSNAPKFFVDYKKGEVVELMNLMKNPKTNSDPTKKKDVIKRVIAYMTLGVDVSKLFFEMVKASITEDIVLKKMVFLYIVNYADQIEQGAILAINTFLKDIKNQNPKIRGLALRSLCSLKFKGSYEYFSNAMYDSLKDSHPYVRKTAVVALLKVYHLNPKLITNRDIDTLYEMVGDRDPLVVMNVLFVLGEILRKQGGIHLTMKMVNHLLNMFNELNEWGQCAVLDLIAGYHPKEQKQIFDIMNLLEEYLKHSSSAIVIGVTKVFVNLTKDNDVLYPQVIKRLRDPMITLLSGCEMSNSFEMAYSILSHIYFLILKGGRVVFSEIYKKFFVKFEEPLYLKKLKLEILIQISTDMNYQDILNEMEEYVNDFSIIFAKDAIKKIGELGLRVDSSLKSIVTVLKGLLNRNTDFIVSETLCVIRELSRKYPAVFDEFANMLESSIITLNNETRGLSALLWLIGEFGDKIEHSSYIVDYLSKLEIQSTEFAYALLLASCKLFFKNPGEMQPILGKVFESILKNYQDVDLRDRTQYYYNLMKNDINMAEFVICGEPTIVDYFYSDFDEEYVDEIYSQFNSLSIIYRKPEEKFTKYTAMEDDENKKEEDDEQQQQQNNTNHNEGSGDNANANANADLIGVEQHSNTLHNEMNSVTIGTVSEDTLMNPYTMDENTYQNLWAQYNTYVTEHAKMIEDEVELAGYVDYLNSKGIFTKAYGTNNGVSTMFLFSNEKNANVIFLVKLTLNHTSYQIDYELKTINEQCAKEYNKYLYENISPLIDQ